MDPAPEADDRDIHALLKRLLDAGDKIIADLAAETSPAGPKAEPYERLTRGVRRTAILLRHIAENPLKSAAEATKNAKTIARRRIARDVDNDITRVAGEGPEAESLRDELRERLDDPALDLDIVNRPISAVIADIRRDLGLANTEFAPSWPRRTPDQARALDAFAAQGGPDLTDPTRYTDTNPTHPEDFEDEAEFETNDPHPLIAALTKRHPVRDG